MNPSYSNSNPIWMEDPELKNIDKNKLLFLNMLFSQLPSSLKNGNLSQEETKKEMLPFLLSLSKLSKENNISFSKNEIIQIINVLQKYSASEDKEIIKKLSSFYYSR